MISSPPHSLLPSFFFFLQTKKLHCFHLMVAWEAPWLEGEAGAEAPPRAGKAPGWLEILAQSVTEHGQGAASPWFGVVSGSHGDRPAGRAGCPEQLSRLARGLPGQGSSVVSRVKPPHPETALHLPGDTCPGDTLWPACGKTGRPLRGLERGGPGGSFLGIWGPMVVRASS